MSQISLVIFLVDFLRGTVAGEAETVDARIVTHKYVLSVQGAQRCPVAVGGSFRAVVVRSHLDCARRCGALPECLHHSYHRTNRTCHLHFSTPAIFDTAPDCLFMANPESFKGTCMAPAMVHMDSNGCTLPFQYLHKQYNNCMKITNGTNSPQCIEPYGNIADCVTPEEMSATQDVINMSLAGGNTVPLPTISSWIVLMSRVNGSVDFNRPWADYKAGFGSITQSEFWIGNENIYLLTGAQAMRFTLRIEVQAKLSGKWYFAEYLTFSIDHEDNGYAIHLSGYTGNAGDSLSNKTVSSKWNHNGMKFKTPDHDADGCAIQYSGGWWFNNCWWSCLGCPYFSRDFSWYTLKDIYDENFGTLRSARMMTRRIFV